MTDKPAKVRVLPRPGHPEHKIVTEFVCPEGHVVQKPNEKSNIIINHIYEERALIHCQECSDYYRIIQAWGAVKADESVVERANEDGYIKRR